MELKTQTSWAGTFLTNAPQTAIVYDTESDAVPIIILEGLGTLRTRTIPVRNIISTRIISAWASSTITLKSRMLGETTVRFLNRTSSKRLYEALNEAREKLTPTLPKGDPATER